MPPRDEQDFEQRRQQIIDGALAAFSSKGFDGASNKDIAQAAGIGSPGLIYHYFKDKVDLLHQVIVARMPLLRLLEDSQSIFERPPAEALPELAERILDAYAQPLAVAIIKLVLAEALRNQRVAQMVSEVGPARGLNLLAGYMQRQMEAGQLRHEDPQVAARSFIGPLMVYTVTSHIFTNPETQAITHRAMAQASVAIFLRGMAPDGSSTAPPSSARPETP